ncbi:SRPBCC family protein [Modestobacter sp. Leaf380]|uniref:SRPBCC family protein n=1 Tax=Modestobacter sp. Leaf380 TaxID=1736356 RepID=UPI0006F80AA5|nr:SRPBCC family protein [Modestobacter sp. Leaf380]KQS64019.1 hypothetical protein ASG41_17865 [Modestobacter sp. Leaf380]
MSEPGTVTTEDDGVRVRVTRHWSLPPERVWAALTEPEPLARWIGRYDGERRATGSGTFTMTAEDGATGDPLTVVECARPERLVVRWVQPGDAGWQVELDLTEADGGTALVLGQLLPPGTDGTDVALGWQWYLTRLDAVLTGGPPAPGWDDFLAASSRRS